MEKSQKTTKSLFLALAIVVAVATFLRLSYEARAADQVDKTCNTANVIKTGAYSSVVQAWTPQHYNVSKVTVYFTDHDGMGGHFPNLATTTLTFEGASSTMVCQMGEPNGSACSYEFEPVHVNAGEVYYFTITLADGTFTSHDAGLLVSDTAGCTGGGPLAMIDPYTSWMYTVYYDDTSFDYPDPDYSVTIVDAETFFDTGLSYKFEKDKRCYSEHPEIPCDIKWWYSRHALNVPLYWFYGTNAGEVDEDSGIIATTTPTDWWSLSATTTLPNIGTTTSGYQEYCVMANATTTLETYQSCGIRVAWLNDDMINRFIEEQTASSTIAARREDCNDCTEESGIFGCSLKKAGCYLFIPDAEDVMRIYDLKEKASNGFPLNIWSDMKDSFYQLTASSSATSSGILAASSTGIYLYWNGTKINNAPIITPETLKNSPFNDFINTWLTYAIYFIMILYLYKRLRQISGALQKD